MNCRHLTVPFYGPVVAVAQGAVGLFLDIIMASEFNCPSMDKKQENKVLKSIEWHKSHPFVLFSLLLLLSLTTHRPGQGQDL